MSRHGADVFGTATPRESEEMHACEDDADDRGDQGEVRSGEVKRIHAGEDGEGLDEKRDGKNGVSKK